MRSAWLLLLPLLFASHAAAADSVDGRGALALAAIVGEVCPLVSSTDKHVLAKLLDGDVDFNFPLGQTISIVSENVTCRGSNLDIKSNSCELKFGDHDIAFTGRKAHELFATLVEVGVPPEGAAGSLFEAVSNLACMIDPNEVKQNSGGGARCQYDPD
jgi:hypothetical protein